MAGGGARRWLGVRARQGRGLVFIPAEGRLGASGVTPVTHACVERPRHGRDVRHSGGQWRATGGAPAGGLAPPSTVHLPRASRGSSRRRSTATGGRSGASACAPDVGTARTAACRRGRTQRRGKACSGVPRHFQFAEPIFKHNFLQILKLNRAFH
jgi:hypothetical protein